VIPIIQYVKTNLEVHQDWNQFALQFLQTDQESPQLYKSRSLKTPAIEQKNDCV